MFLLVDNSYLFLYGKMYDCVFSFYNKILIFVNVYLNKSFIE